MAIVIAQSEWSGAQGAPSSANQLSRELLQQFGEALGPNLDGMLLTHIVSSAPAIRSLFAHLELSNRRLENIQFFRKFLTHMGFDQLGLTNEHFT